MREEVKTLDLNKYEQGVAITALNDMWNRQLVEHKPTDAVDELLEKIFAAPSKKVKLRHAQGQIYEAR